MKSVVVVAMVFALCGAAAADIIEWRDTDGVRHYTNLKGEVPPEQQGTARVVVDELMRRPENAPAAAAPPAPAAPEQRREAQVVYDRSRVADAYLQGLQRGLDTARLIAAGEGGSVQINGPLAVARATTSAPFGYFVPDYYPFVTTSFDRGRSRHLTLRLLLQEQFAIDRAEERLLPPCSHAPLGVALNPFLPRGLPHGFPRQTRVIVR